MDFMCEDNSYRSTVAMANFTVALQVQMTDNSKFEWVERSELDKAENELKLKGFGLIDRSEVLRNGHWVKADWEVFGDVTTNTTGDWMISLEVVDMQHTDVLAASNFDVSPANGGPYQMKTEDVSRVAIALRSLLDQARQVYLSSSKQETVAFLFLTREDLGNNIGDLETALRNSLLVVSTNTGQFHLIQLHRAGQAMDEANLVLSGLAESEPDAWEKVADYYVWGSYTFRPSLWFDRQTHQWHRDQLVDVSLDVWDGKNNPHAVTLVVTNENSPGAIAEQMAQTIAPYLHSNAVGTVIEGVRQGISDSLIHHFDELVRGNPALDVGLNSPEGRRQWLEAVQVLEAACFFDPGNAKAREQWLRLRWGMYASFASRNEFFFARRRSEAWGKYVDNFGFKTVLANTNLSSIATEYVLSAWRPFEMFCYSQYNQAQWGVPRDAGLRELTEWQNQFGSEFISRLLKAPDQYNGAYLEALQGYFKGIGQPGGERKLLAQLKAADNGKNSELSNSPPPLANTEQKVRLPRVAELDAAKTGDIFSLPPLAFLPTLIEPSIQTIAFPSDVQIKYAKSITFLDDALWLEVEQAEPVKINPQNILAEKDLQPVMEDHPRWWQVELNHQKFQLVSDSQSSDIISNLVLHRSAITDSQGNSWYVDGNGLHATNSKTGQTHDEWFPVSVTIQADLFRGFPGIPQRRKPDSQLAQEIRQRLALRRQLLEAHKADANRPNLFIPNSRLPGGVWGLAEDGDFLWVLVSHSGGYALMAYHPASRKWVGGFSFNGKGAPQALACGDGKLWVACDYGASYVLQAIETSSVKSIPPERWLSDEVSSEELSARIADLSEHERAVYYYFSGNDAAAVKLLQTQAEDELDAESLFLLQSSFAEMGESNQASHFEQKLTEAFPDSVFTKVVSFNDLNHNRTIK